MASEPKGWRYSKVASFESPKLYDKDIIYKGDQTK